MDYSPLGLQSIVPDYYHPLLHTITASNTMVTALSVWLIVAHSPPSMATYKWFLLNLSLSCFIYDTFVTVLADPIPLFLPAALCSESLVVRLLTPFIPPAWGLALHNILLSSCGVSISYAFLYRLAALRPQRQGDWWYVRRWIC